MHSYRFDSFTSSLSKASSRRGASQALGALAFGALGLLGFADTHAAKKGKKGKRKGQHKTDCPTCQTCPTPISCIGQAADTPCDGGGKCYQGGCVGRPTCTGYNVTCQPGNTASSVCCSGYCASTGAPIGTCSRGNAGRACYETTDCQPDFICVGYRCQQKFVN